MSPRLHLSPLLQHTMDDAIGQLKRHLDPSIEGGGVKPDLEVALTRDELLEVGDPDLATAVEWILDEERTES